MEESQGVSMTLTLRALFTGEREVGDSGNWAGSELLGERNDQKPGTVLSWAPGVVSIVFFTVS
jgi:hypothetical protein